MEDSLVRECNGVPIYVDGDGRFYAHVSGRLIRRAKMSEILRLVRGESLVVRAILADADGWRNLSYGYKIVEVVSRDKRSGRYRTKEKGLLGIGDNPRHYDEDVLAELSDISASYQQLKKRWRIALESLPYVTERDFGVG